MVRVAIVESLPYEALGNGDGIYLDGIRRFLTSLGCEVTTFISDMPVGRRKPWLVMQTRCDPRLHQWRMRQAIGFRQKTFISLSPDFVRKALAVVIARWATPYSVTVSAESGQDAPSQSGRVWIERVLRTANPDIVIYYLGAAAFISAFEQPWISVALGGWLRSRWIKASDASAAALDQADEALLEAMRHANQVAFNNEADIQIYEAVTKQGNATSWGMSFPPIRRLKLSEDAVVLYVGARTGPNQEGLDWLIAQIWPLVRAAVPGARLRLVGGMTTGRSSDHAQGIEVVGFVTDLADEYKRAQVVVAPILAGTHGTKTKVAEALGFGRPVVTTTIGIDRGAPHRLEAAVDVFDDPVGFASAVVRLLLDENLRAVRSGGAALAYNAVFSNAVAYGSLKALVDSIATA